MKQKQRVSKRVFNEASDDDDELFDPKFSSGLSSLASERMIFFPPFLPANEIKIRRFSGPDPNDRWWEWEAELGLESLDGRPRGTERS